MPDWSLPSGEELTALLREPERLAKLEWRERLRYEMAYMRDHHCSTERARTHFDQVVSRLADDLQAQQRGA